MSIERDQDFEQLEDIAVMMAENPGIEFENGKYVYYGLDPRTAFAVVYIGGAWMAWQAKAQAVPEGFVVVPKDPTPKMIDSTWDYDEEIYGMSSNERNRFIYKAMIKAQEPK